MIRRRKACCHRFEPLLSDSVMRFCTHQKITLASPGGEISPRSSAGGTLTPRFAVAWGGGEKRFSNLRRSSSEQFSVCVFVSIYYMDLFKYYFINYYDITELKEKSEKFVNFRKMRNEDNRVNLK